MKPIALGGAHMEQLGRRPFGHISQIKFGDQWDARGQSSLILSDSSASPAPAILYLFSPSIPYFLIQKYLLRKVVNKNQYSLCQDGAYI